MRKLEPLEAERPDLVLVVGDVNSTLAAALTAAKLRIPVAHVEAGLRSFDRGMPEEINRLLTDAVADFLFVTEESGRENLLHEGIRPEKISFVGNVMIDALRVLRGRWERSSICDRLSLGADRPYAVLTLHRPSNVDDPAVLLKFIEALRALSSHLPIVFPVHARVRSLLVERGWMSPADSPDSPPGPGITWLESLGYFDFIALFRRARLVLTDSGGVQEETTVLGVPCLTLRETTEQLVTVTHGTNRVIGANPRRIVAEALRTLVQPPRPTVAPPLWDGQAAGRIVEILLEHGPRRDGRAPGAPRVVREYGHRTAPEAIADAA